VIGAGAPWKGESERLVEFFEDGDGEGEGEGKKRVVWFRGGHHMPVEDGVNRGLVKVILEACKGV
jgi:hypothetical protein